jgi:hypothetical protein
MTSVEFPRDPHLLLHMVRVARASEPRICTAYPSFLEDRPVYCKERTAWSLHWAFLTRVKAYARLVLELDVQRELRDWFATVYGVTKIGHTLIEWRLPNRTYHRSGFLPESVRFTKLSARGEFLIRFEHVTIRAQWGRLELCARGRDDLTSMFNDFLWGPGGYEGQADFLALLRRCAFDLIRCQYPRLLEVRNRDLCFEVYVRWPLSPPYTYYVQMRALYVKSTGETHCDVFLYYVNENKVSGPERIASIHDAGAFVAAALLEHAPPSLFDGLPLTENETETANACVRSMCAGQRIAGEVPMFDFEGY